MKKYRITPEHQIELNKIRDKYIANALRTDAMTEYDREQMRVAMRGLYNNARLPYPGDDKIIFVASPLIAQFASGIGLWLLTNKGSQEAGLDAVQAARQAEQAAGQAARQAENAAVQAVEQADHAARQAAQAADQAAAQIEQALAQAEQAAGHAAGRAENAARQAIEQADHAARQAARQEDMAAGLAAAQIEQAAAQIEQALENAAEQAVAQDVSQEAGLAAQKAARQAAHIADQAARQAVRQAVEQAEHAADQAADQAAAQIEQALAQAEQAAGHAAGRAENAADQALGRADHAAVQAVQQAENAAVQAAAQIEQAAAQIEQALENAAVQAAAQVSSLDIYINAFVQIAQKHGNAALHSAQNAWRYRTRSALWPWYQVYGDFFKNVAKLPGQWEKWEPLNLDALHGGVRYMTKDFTIIADRPEILKHDDENRLHCETGPAVKWRDGMEQYYWRGIAIPDWFITRKDLLTAAKALSIENAELRRCACDIIGWDKVLEDKSLNPVYLDEDTPEIGTLIEVNHEALGGKARFLKVLCGTGRTFVLPVDNQYHTALEANASLGGWTKQSKRNPIQYIPFIRS